MLTIFTPTYNRKTFLITAYRYLLSQTNKNFVWLIVDDGSSDGTEEMIHQWIAEGQLQIEYVYQQNGGKMRAHNRGVGLCRTELFVCVDSDDYLVEDAVENILKMWENRKKKDLAGMVAYRGKSRTETMHGECFPVDVQESTLGNLYKSGFDGETTLVFRTEVLRSYPFPEFENERFVPEAVVYDKIDLRYRLAVIPEIWMISKYQSDGLTKSIKRLREENPQGWLCYYRQRIELEPGGLLRYKYVAHGICFSWKLRENIWKSLPAPRWEIALALPAAALLRLVGKM